MILTQFDRENYLNGNSDSTWFGSGQFWFCFSSLFSLSQIAGLGCSDTPSFLPICPRGILVRDEDRVADLWF